MVMRVELLDAGLAGRAIPANAEADTVNVPANGAVRVTLENGTQFTMWCGAGGGGVQMLRAKAGLRDIITDNEIQRFTISGGTAAGLQLATINNVVPKVAFRTVGTKVILLLNPNQQ